MSNEKIKLADGNAIPVIGLGTYVGENIKEVIKSSIEIGYRLIDTAFVYANESAIGEGIEDKIKDGTIKREDLFVVTKLWNTKHKPEDVLPSIKKQLASLRLAYVDLYLMHWPFAQKQVSSNEYAIYENPEENIPFEDTWRAMEQCVKLGLAKSIGISNFNSAQIERLLKIAEIKPVVNQVECNPYFSQEKLRQFCKQRNIVLMAYSPLYAPNRPGSVDHSLNLFEEPVIKSIAKKYEKTSSQVVLRYLIQCEVVPIPKTDKTERLKSNIDVFDFKLTDEEFENVRKLDKNLRCTNFEAAKDFKEYPFRLEF